MEVLADAGKERQEGTQGNWQKDLRFKEEVELVERGHDLSDNAFFNASCFLRSKIRQFGRLQGRISET